MSAERTAADLEAPTNNDGSETVAAAPAESPFAAGTVEGDELAQLRAKAEERDELVELLQRSRADFENYQKRMRREMDNERRYAALPLVRDLLPVLDNLQRAVQTGQSATHAAALVEGVTLVLRQFEEALARHHIRPIEAVGKPLDPNLHEAVSQQSSPDQAPGTVLAELERGYLLHERVVRPSKVMVAGGAVGPLPDGRG